MSPNQVIPVENGALNPIAERVLKVPSLTHEYGKDGIVIAVKAELIVRGSLFDTEPGFREALAKVADRVGRFVEIEGPHTTVVTRDSASSGESKRAAGGDYDFRQNRLHPLLSELEVWRLKDHETRNSIDESRRLRALVKPEPVPIPSGHELMVPAVSPNHVAILCPAAGGCPAAPPQPAPRRRVPFVEPPSRESTAKVTILDSGYIWIDPPHTNLDERVTVIAGQRLDPTTGTWVPDEPDGLYTDPLGQLDGISGHGTFIAGLIAHIAPRTRLEVVGLRNQEVEIPDLDPGTELGLFETEVAIAHAMLLRCDTDVIQCGFAFPTLDDYPSLPFAAAMAQLREETAPHAGRVAVVSPAGNEQSRQRYWPAALPDVIGVASTNRRGNARAWFSNWGDWCDCAARGEYVYSTFIRWDGPVEGEPLTDTEDFDGWARWDGTSFAAPKVSAEIARLFVEGNESTPPADIGDALIAGTTGVPLTPVTDATLSGPPGVTLPYLHIR
ncbi:MAG TPA: S8/S53 family peptidase [Solirubrobacteraceae bacterium]|nr:S8/S53 family peptidase [Solirubrobacteraceae bacterium]